MPDLGEQSIHIVSVGEDANLLQLANLLQASETTTRILQPNQGLADVIDILEASAPTDGYDAIHLYGHGSTGQQSLGRDNISSPSLRSQADLWAQLKRFVHNDSDLLLYGCETGAGREGSTLVHELAQLTGLDVAASDDITGQIQTTQANDWALEVSVGTIESQQAQAVSQWQGALQLEQWDDSEPYPFQVETVSWQTSEKEPHKQFAWLDVPLDYYRPHQGNATLALARIPARGKNPVGSLIFNPGGPGGSGLERLNSIANDLSDTIREQFHIVTFDPRGIGKSTPTLEAAPGLFPVTPPAGSADWTQTLNASREAFREANIQTQINNYSFINHLGTRNVARDMELIRQAIGDQPLNYLGLSYGTRIGYTYAEMFPNNIRTMILDGNINPNGDFADLTFSAKGPDIAMELVRQKEPEIAAAFDESYNILKEKPLNIGDGMHFDLGDYITLATTILSQGSGFGGFTSLRDRIKEIADNGENQNEEKDRLKQLKSIFSQNNTNAGGAFAIINRLDYGDLYDAEAQRRNVQEVVDYGPLGGPLAISYAAGAEGFDLRSEPVPNMSRQRLKDKVMGLPVVISNATNDTYTPRFWALEMTEAFANHAFLEQVSTKHCISTKAVNCISNPIDMYLLNQTLPDSKICPWQDTNQG